MCEDEKRRRGGREPWSQRAVNKGLALKGEVGSEEPPPRTDTTAPPRKHHGNTTETPRKHHGAPGNRSVARLGLVLGIFGFFLFSFLISAGGWSYVKDTALSHLG